MVPLGLVDRFGHHGEISKSQSRLIPLPSILVDESPNHETVVAWANNPLPQILAREELLATY